MTDVSFIQRSRIGRGIFLLREQTLEVTTSVFGVNSARMFSLSSISPDYQPVAQRFWILILVPLILTVLALAAVSWILHDDRIQDTLAIYPLMLAIVWTIVTFNGVPRVELFVFFDHWRKPLFYIVREPAQRTDCERFIAALVDRIEMVAHGQRQEARHPISPIASAVKLASSDSAVGLKREDRWKLSIGCGVLAAAFPLIRLGGEWIEITFFVEMLGIAGGLLFGVLSFLAKERLRLLALFGLGLALIAPVIR